MDTVEKISYSLLVIVGIGYLCLILVGMVALWPVGILGLVVIFSIGLLFIKILKERLANKEDDYYSENVEK